MRTALLALMFAIFSSIGAQERYSLQITNSSDLDRENAIVEIPLKKIKIDKNLIGVVDEDGKELISQITSDDTLLFQASIKGKERKQFYVTSEVSSPAVIKVYGRYFPERYGDFAWENDCLGFRLYGNPLEQVQAPTNGIDIWLKRTERMVLEDWYENDLSRKASYHVDHGEGCDPYGVGSTLGAGAITPYIDGKLIRNKNFIAHKLIDNGPLRIKFELVYPDIHTSGKIITDRKVITLDAGSYYTKVEQFFGAKKLDVAVGVVRRAGENKIYASSDKRIMIYEEPEMAKNGQVYVGVIFPNGKMEVKQDSYKIGEKVFNHNLAIGEASYRGFVYYTGFGWSKSEHPKVADFRTYTDEFVSMLDKPLKVKIKRMK